MIVFSLFLGTEKSLFYNLQYALLLRRWDFEKMPSNSCLICHEGFDGLKKISALPCGHVMHYDCLVKWVDSCLRSSGVLSCPACRRPFQWSPANGTVFKLHLDMGEEEIQKKRAMELEKELEREKAQHREARREIASKTAEVHRL